MVTYAERLTRALSYRGMSQSGLARQLGVKPQAVQYLCARGSGSKHSSEIARVLDISLEWLATGRGTMLADDNPPSPASTSEPLKQSLDPAVIKEILDIVEWLAEQQGIRLSSEDRAHHIAVNYDDVAHEHEQERQYRERVTRIVEKTWRQGMPGDEGIDEPSTQPSEASRE